MNPQILSGIETEYGLYVEGSGAAEQIDHAMAFVRSYVGQCFAGWDYRKESPRADLRGFVLDKLAYDPEDSKFDEGRKHAPDSEVRSDRILANGARFYNDHGHPEYATPECWSLNELGLHDCAGEIVLANTARVYSEKLGLPVKVYKNNTDFHGASYGTHESFLVPRTLGFERLYQAVLPMLVVRQVLSGAGKVGSESGASCTYQISQRADFFVEPVNAETLYRRPIFNTRDEPHANPADWIRLHVISGDANMIPAATRRKVGLVKLAVLLAEKGEAPVWKLRNPVQAFQNISRDESYEFEIELENRSWTNAEEIFESYFAAAEAVLELDEELTSLIEECRQLLKQLRHDYSNFRRQVDWAAKRAMLEMSMDSDGSDWRSDSLRSFDLEYHNADRAEGLFYALADMGEVEALPSETELIDRLSDVQEPTRAFARSIAVQKFSEHLITACWASLTFKLGENQVEVPLAPEKKYPRELSEAADVGTFVTMLRGEK